MPKVFDRHAPPFDRLTEPEIEEVRAALGRVAVEHPGVHLAVVGHAAPPNDWGGATLPTHWLGRQDDSGCIAAYRAADVVVVPSRQDNSPQTATEALSCGTPVVAFDTSGLPDFVDHRETGYLARPENTGTSPQASPGCSPTAIVETSWEQPPGHMPWRAGRRPSSLRRTWTSTPLLPAKPPDPGPVP